MIEIIFAGIVFGVPISLVCVMHILKYLDKKQRAKAVKAEVDRIMENKCHTCAFSERLLREEYEEKEARLAEREEKLTRSSRARFERQLLHEFSASDLHVFLPDIYPHKNPLFWPDEMKDRLFRAVRDDISIKEITFIKSKIIGSEGDEYTTTLRWCSCPDCNIRKIKPCKHMLYLYLHLGHAAYSGADARRYTKQIQQAADATTPKKRKT